MGPSSLLVSAALGGAGGFPERLAPEREAISPHSQIYFPQMLDAEAHPMASRSAKWVDMWDRATQDTLGQLS